MLDDRLYEQSGERCGEPEQRELVVLRAQILVDGAHVRELQIPLELNSEESEPQLDDLPELGPRLLHLYHLYSTTRVYPFGQGLW